jgi:hypothetical protein
MHSKHLFYLQITQILTEILRQKNVHGFALPHDEHSFTYTQFETIQQSYASNRQEKSPTEIELPRSYYFISVGENLALFVNDQDSKILSLIERQDY